jgi:RNA-directed DNA polymerase
MVAEAMTETALVEDTRDRGEASQVVRKCVPVRKAHSLIGEVYHVHRWSLRWQRQSLHGR